MILLELLLAATIVVLAVVAPQLGRSTGTRVERYLATTFASPVKQIIAVGVLAVIARALFLPWLGSPIPIAHDEYSLLLQAQTFMAGRLANPTPALWEHFEGIHLDVIPAYASMYFPGRGLPLALGMLIADNAWIGVWIAFALMCMAAVWMLQAWVSPPFAMLGGVLVALRLGIFSYWINSYWSGAFIAFGAMLIVGAVPRFLKQPDWGFGLSLAVGVFILLTSRPVEGALLCLPLAAFLLWNIWRSSSQERGRMFLRAGLPVALSVALGGGWLLAYDKATTGDALTTPYDLNRQTYAITPAFLISPPIQSEQRGPPHFREFYKWENLYFAARHSPAKMIRGAISKVYYNWNFYIGFILTPAFLAGLWASRRKPILAVTLAFFFAGYLFETWNFPHYTAPIFPILLIITMMGFEWLRGWTPRQRQSGSFLTRAMPAGIALTLALPAAAVVADSPGLVSGGSSSLLSCCALQRTSPRSEIMASLQAQPGKDMVLVSTDPARHPVHVPMIYNEPDIGAAEIIWAHSLGPQRDNALVTRYRGRRVWQVQWRQDHSFALTPWRQSLQDSM